MSNLEKINILDKLPLGLKRFAELRVNQTPVKNLSINFKKQQCYDLITRIHASCGNKGTDSDVLVFQTNELLSCLNEKYSELTIAEVGRALEMLLAGEFGPFMGLFKKSYYQALKAYYELPQRTQSMKQYLTLMEPQKTEISPEEKKQKNIKACKWYFNEYKKNGVLPNGHYAMYQTMWDLGMVRLTKEEKHDVNKRVTEDYTKKIETDRKRLKISKTQMIDILSNLDGNPTLKGLLRKEALIVYFNNLIKENKEI